MAGSLIFAKEYAILFKNLTNTVCILGVSKMCFIAEQCKHHRIFTTDFTTNQIRIR